VVDDVSDVVVVVTGGRLHPANKAVPAKSVAIVTIRRFGMVKDMVRLQWIEGSEGWHAGRLVFSKPPARRSASFRATWLSWTSGWTTMWHRWVPQPSAR
jgi:hypothetical protein